MCVSVCARVFVCVCFSSAVSCQLGDQQTVKVSLSLFFFLLKVCSFSASKRRKKKSLEEEEDVPEDVITRKI